MKDSGWAGGRLAGWETRGAPRARARAGTGRELGLVDEWHSGTLNWSLEVCDLQGWN